MPNKLRITIETTAPEEHYHRVLESINRALAWYMQVPCPREEDKEHALTLLDIQQNMLEEQK